MIAFLIHQKIIVSWYVHCCGDKRNITVLKVVHRHVTFIAITIFTTAAMVEVIEFVATVPHRSCGYVDKLSDRKIVNICSVTRDVLHLAIQVLNNLSSQREKNLNGSWILNRVELVIPSF